VVGSKLTHTALAQELTGDEGVGSSGWGAASELSEAPGPARGEGEAVRGYAHVEWQWWKQGSVA
jgi:hypothetical protein